MVGLLATTQPYVQAALISAIPATLAASASWYSNRKGRKESHDDTDKIDAHIEQMGTRFDTIDNKFERVETQFAKLDLRLDSIEDKVERHLGWHRTNAERDLEHLLKKEVNTSDLSTYRPTGSDH